MFCAVTVYIAFNLDLQSIAYVGKREFPGDEILFPGPLGYQFLLNTDAITIIPDVMFLLNGWLADALLVYFVPNRLTGCLTYRFSPPALSLLCNLCHELLGYCLPMPHVSCHVGYAPNEGTAIRG
jgi:hypothetical protein